MPTFSILSLMGSPATIAPPAQVVAPPPVADQDVAPAVAPKGQIAEKPVETVIRRERFNVAVLSQQLD